MNAIFISAMPSLNAVIRSWPLLFFVAANSDCYQLRVLGVRFAEEQVMCPHHYCKTTCRGSAPTMQRVI